MIRELNTREHRGLVTESITNGQIIPSFVALPRICELRVRSEFWDAYKNAPFLPSEYLIKGFEGTSETTLKEMEAALRLNRGDSEEQVKNFCSANGYRPNRFIEGKYYYTLFKKTFETFDSGMFVERIRKVENLRALPEFKDILTIQEPVVSNKKKKICGTGRNWFPSDPDSGKNREDRAETYLLSILRCGDILTRHTFKQSRTVGYDFAISNKLGELMAVYDAKSRPVLSGNEERALLDLHEKNIPYYLIMDGAEPVRLDPNKRMRIEGCQFSISRKKKVIKGVYE